jgi:hypothetical protein
MLLGTVVCIFQDLTCAVFGGGAEDVERPAQQRPGHSRQGLRHHRLHHRCLASPSNLRRFASAVANFKQMRSPVFRSTSAASWRSRRQRRSRTTRPLGLQFSLLKGLPRPMVGLRGFSFFSLGLKITNKKRKGNYADRHEHGLRRGRITSLWKSIRRNA